MNLQLTFAVLTSATLTTSSLLLRCVLTMWLRKTSKLCVLAIALTACFSIVCASLSATKQSELLRAHNYLRASTKPKPCSPLLPVVWNRKLATVAQRYAESCIWRHNPKRTSQAGGDFYAVGENLAFTTHVNSNVTELVIAWYKEIDSYNFYSGKCDDVCGHYTQIVWNTSTEVGCGAHVCRIPDIVGYPIPNSNFKEAIILVCNYGPAGNYQGQRPYEAASCPDSENSSAAGVRSTLLCILAVSAFSLLRYCPWDMFS